MTMKQFEAHILKDENSERTLKVILGTAEIPGFPFGGIFLFVVE